MPLALLEQTASSVEKLSAGVQGMGYIGIMEKKMNNYYYIRVISRGYVGSIGYILGYIGVIYNPKPYTLNSSYHFLFHYPYIPYTSKMHVALFAEASSLRAFRSL